MTFASLIARCAKDIDYLIESLPSEDSSTELQVCSYLICRYCSVRKYVNNELKLFHSLPALEDWSKTTMTLT